MAVRLETLGYADREQHEIDFGFRDVRDPELGAFLRDFHREVVPDLGINPTLAAVVRESSGYADVNAHFDRPTAEFIKENNVVPIDQSKRVAKVHGRAIYAIAVLEYTIAESNPTIKDGVIWEGYEGERGIVGEARYRLGENPLRNILTDPYPLSPEEENALREKEVGQAELREEKLRDDHTNGVGIELRPVDTASFSDKQEIKSSNDEVDALLLSVASVELRNFLQPIGVDIIGDSSNVAKQDLLSSHALEVLGSNKPYLENLLRNLDTSGVLKYDVHHKENGKGRPRHVYTREKTLVLGAIIRRVGKKEDYGDVNWENIVDEVRSDLGADNPLHASLSEPSEETQERHVITYTDSNDRARRVNAGLRIQQEDFSSHPAMAFSDKQLLQLWVDYRRLPNDIDELDHSRSIQHGVAIAHAQNTVRIAFGTERQLDATVSLLEYRTAIARILEDAQKAERLEPLRQRLAEEALAEIEESPRVVNDERQESETMEGNEHIIYIGGPSHMPATFVEAIDADYEAIYASRASGTFRAERFGLTPETYDYLVRATEVIIARSHGHEPSFSHLLGRKPDTEDVRGAIAVVSHYMKQHGITSFKELCDRIQ